MTASACRRASLARPAGSGGASLEPQGRTVSIALELIERFRTGTL